MSRPTLPPEAPTGPFVDREAAPIDTLIRAVMKTDSIKSTRHGDWELSFTIPASYTDDVLALSPYRGQPILLGIHAWRRNAERGSIPVSEANAPSPHSGNHSPHPPAHDE